MLIGFVNKNYFDLKMDKKLYGFFYSILVTLNCYYRWTKKSVFFLSILFENKQYWIIELIFLKKNIKTLNFNNFFERLKNNWLIQYEFQSSK